MKNAIRCRKNEVRGFEGLNCKNLKQYFYIYVIYDCEDLYVGSTGGSIWKRITEHVNSKKSAANEMLRGDPQILFKRYEMANEPVEMFIKRRYIKEQAYIDKFRQFGFHLVNAAKAYDKDGSGYKTFCKFCTCFIGNLAKHNESKGHRRKLESYKLLEREFNYVPAIN